MTRMDIIIPLQVSEEGEVIRQHVVAHGADITPFRAGCGNQPTIELAAPESSLNGQAKIWRKQRDGNHGEILLMEVYDGQESAAYFSHDLTLLLKIALHRLGAPICNTTGGYRVPLPGWLRLKESRMSQVPGSFSGDIEEDVTS